MINLKIDGIAMYEGKESQTSGRYTVLVDVSEEPRKKQCVRVVYNNKPRYDIAKGERVKAEGSCFCSVSPGSNGQHYANLVLMAE